MAHPHTKSNTDFLKFLDMSKKGDEFVYFVGPTVVDENGRRVEAAQAPFEACQQGLVSLVQFRVPNRDGWFSYIAQKR